MTSRWLAFVVIAFVWLGAARPARATEYEVFVDVDDEEDLNELYVTDQIGEATYYTLLDLLRRGVDLGIATREDLYALPNLTYADADRILGYRKEAGGIADLATLVAAGVLTRRKAESIAAFIIVPNATGGRAPIDGYARFQTVWTVGDRRAPAMLLQARINALRYLTAGFTGTLERNRIGQVHYDPNRGALTADGARPRPRLAKAYIQWDTPEYGIVGGTYRIGFGQRLTFDNSGRYTPNGFYFDDGNVTRVVASNFCKLSHGELDDPSMEDQPPVCEDFYAAPDYRFRYGLLGVAAGAKHIALPRGWLQLYGFFSYQPRSIYQYQVANASTCPDPTDDDNPGCDSPIVYETPDRPLDPARNHKYQTLPNIVDLVVGGGNFAWWADRRSHVGVTGYGAVPRWKVGGADLDFQDWSPFPFGGAFGAVGADASWGYRWADVFAEVTRSFDNQPAGSKGGFAGILRHTATWDVHEIEVSARFYDDEFENPFARPIAAADQSAGLRASNEAGGRFRYNAFLAKRVSLRTLFDMWTDVNDAKPQLRTYFRMDVDATRWFTPGFWFDVQDRDLRTREFGECYFEYGSSATETDPDLGSEQDPDVVGEGEEPQECSGERYSVTARAKFKPHDRVWFRLQYVHKFIDDPNYSGSFRQDLNAAFTLTARPIDPLRLSFRTRYYNEDVRSDVRLRDWVWGVAQVSYEVRRWFRPGIRYDIIAFVDDRDSTLEREPNPIHWLWFEVESRF